jgi:hypothetical protein
MFNLTMFPAGRIVRFQVDVGAALVQLELIANMRCLEPQAIVETVGIRAGLIGCQLNQGAGLGAALLDRPIEHGAPDPLIPVIARNSDRFNLPAFRPSPREARDEGELERSNGAPIAFNDTEKLVGICRDFSESAPIAGEIFAHPLATTAQLIVV